MYRFLVYIVLFAIASSFLSSCKSTAIPVDFTYTRTPLMPVKYRGITEYSPEAQLLYEEQIQAIEAGYEKEVEFARLKYQQELKQFQERTLAERVLQQTPEPQLELPPAPTLPFRHNTEELANHLKVAGMTRGEIQPVRIVLQVDAFEFTDLKLNVNTRKRKKDGVEIIDSTYNYTARIKQDLAIYAKTPFGEEYHEFIPETQKHRLIRGRVASDTLTAYNNMMVELQSRERNLVYDNIIHVNDLLNSLFATVEVNYKVELHEPKNTNKHDYSDIARGVQLAKNGLNSIKSNPNEAIENMNEAYVIWQNAFQEFSRTGKGRMTTEVTKAVLKNLILVSIFTENWDGALYFKNELKRFKLSGKDRRDLATLDEKYHDLRSRYEALTGK